MDTLRHKLSVFTKAVSLFKNWPHAIAYRLGFTAGSMVIRLRDGSKFKIRARTTDPADLYVINECYREGIHDGLLPHMKNAKIGIDLGAHIGTFSVWAAHRSPATIYAFEPSSTNLPLLAHNIRLNNLDARIRVLPRIVSNVSGKEKLYIVENSGLISTLEEHHKNRSDSGALIRVDTVPSISLQDFFNQEKIEVCDFMKVDVEGKEYDIFMALPDEVYAKIQSMSIEIGSRHDTLLPHIMSKGFKVAQSEGSGEYIFTR